MSLDFEDHITTEQRMSERNKLNRLDRMFTFTFYILMILLALRVGEIAWRVFF